MEYNRQQAALDAHLALERVYKTPKIVKKYNKILKKIKKAATTGKWNISVYIPKSIRVIIYSKLKEDGYSVKYEQNTIFVWW